MATPMTLTRTTITPIGPPIPITREALEAYRMEGICRCGHDRSEHARTSVGTFGGCEPCDCPRYSRRVARIQPKVTLTPLPWEGQS